MAQYLPPTLTVDMILFSLIDKRLHVLLIKRTNEPFKDQWALPGGYNAQNETTYDALGRIMDKKTGISLGRLAYIEQLYTFDTVARDPRGHAVSVSYMALASEMEPAAFKGSEPTAWFSLSDLPKLAFDHKKIIRYAQKRLASKLNYTNIAFALLPEHFTLSQLQNLYEAVLERQLDKRNFRKKMVSLRIVEPTSQKTRGVSHRPAQLYRFIDRNLTEFEQFLN